MSHTRAIVATLAGLLVGLLALANAQRQRTAPQLPSPDFADVQYGPHQRNVFDLWLAKSKEHIPIQE
jgi:hypothetical protein